LSFILHKDVSTAECFTTNCCKNKCGF